MQDEEIIALYFQRSQNAIPETAKKYDKYCNTIALHVLRNPEDSEECVQDAYWKVWNTIPPMHPLHFQAFLGKVVRNTALHLWEKLKAQKRSAGQIPLVLEELAECIPSNENVEQHAESKELYEILNQFLGTLSEEPRRIFIRRYWYLDSIAEIAEAYQISISKVKMSLHRTRNKLKTLLEKEGVL